MCILLPVVLWPSGSREVKNVKSLQSDRRTDMAEGQHMIRKASLNLWFNWAKNKMNQKYCVRWSKMNNVQPAEFFLCLLWVEVFVLDDGTECVPLLYWESLESPVSALSKNIVGSIFCDCSLPHSLHSESISKSYMRSWRRVHQLHHYKDIKLMYFVCNLFHFILIFIALLLHFFVFSNF